MTLGEVCPLGEYKKNQSLNIEDPTNSAEAVKTRRGLPPTNSDQREADN